MRHLDGKSSLFLILLAGLALTGCSPKGHSGATVVTTAEDLADAVALERASYVLPFVILAFPVVWLWVGLWRRFVKRRG